MDGPTRELLDEAKVSVPDGGEVAGEAGALLEVGEAEDVGAVDVGRVHDAGVQGRRAQPDRVPVDAWMSSFRLLGTMEHDGTEGPSRFPPHQCGALGSTGLGLSARSPTPLTKKRPLHGVAHYMRE